MHTNAIDSMFSECWAAEKLLKRGCLMVHSATIWNDVLEVGTANTFLKRGRLIVHSSEIWDDVLEVRTCVFAQISI